MSLQACRSTKTPSFQIPKENWDSDSSSVGFANLGLQGAVVGDQPHKGSIRIQISMPMERLRVLSVWIQ